MAEVALRPQLLDELFEWDVLVGVGAEGRLSRARQQLAKARIARQIAAQHQRIDEEPDQVLDLGPVAVGDRGADRQVLAAGGAGQQRLEAGEQRHEQGRPLGADERLQPLGQRRGQGVGQAAAAGALHPRPRPVRWQLDHRRRTGQPLAPPAELRLEHLSLQPAPLPGGEVGVLHRQVRQRRGQTPHEGRVQSGQLAHQHADRPPVCDDVVDRKEQRVLPLAEPLQGRPDERPALQVEHPPRLLAGEADGLALAFALGQRRQIHNR